MARILIEKLTFDDTSESRNKDKSKNNDHLHNISSEIVNSFSVFPFFSLSPRTNEEEEDRENKLENIVDETGS